MDKGRYAEAVTCFEEVLRVDNIRFEAMIGRGDALTKLKEYDRAIREFGRVLVAYPNNSIAKEHLQRIEDAIEEDRQALLPPKVEKPKSKSSTIEDVYNLLMVDSEKKSKNRKSHKSSKKSSRKKGKTSKRNRTVSPNDRNSRSPNDAPPRKRSRRVTCKH